MKTHADQYLKNYLACIKKDETTPLLYFDNNVDYIDVLQEVQPLESLLLPLWL